MTEKQLQSSIIELLNYSGKAYVWNINAGKIYVRNRNGKIIRAVQLAPAGHSDIQGIRRSDGKFIGLEVKLPKRRKNVTDLQKAFLGQIKDAGGISAVICSPEEALEVVEGD